MRHHLLVDSRDRDFVAFPRPDTYRLRLPRRYRGVVGARVLSADIPSSFFVFSAARGNTTLKVRLGGVAKTLVLPDGNYDTESMCAELRTALLAAYPANTFAIEVDPRTMQLVVSCYQGGTFAVDTTGVGSDAPPTDWGLAYYLGFPKGALTSGATVRSPGMVNVNPVTYILLDIAELGAIDEAGMYGAGGSGPGAFCKIPINAISFEYIYKDLDTATDLVDSRPPVPKLETLTVRFRYHDGKPVDFRGVEHSFLLELVTREPSPLPALPALSIQPPKPKRKKAPPTVPAPPAVPAVPAPPAPPAPNYKKWAMGGAALAAAGGAWWYFAK